MAKAVLQSFQPSAIDIALYAGDGASLRLTVQDGAGTAMPLSGAVTAQIRTRRSDLTAKADWAVDLTQAANGVITLKLTGAQTAALIGSTGAEFKGFWDVQWQAVGSEPLTLVQGTVSCIQDVTRP
jgi:hypothetical protein